MGALSSSRPGNQLCELRVSLATPVPLRSQLEIGDISALTSYASVTIDLSTVPNAGVV